MTIGPEGDLTILSDARVWKEMGLQAAPWRFVVLACGVDYLVREHTGVVVSCTVPSLHLLGDADPFLMESELLLGRFNDRVGVALRHPFGHALPLELAIRHPEHLELICYILPLPVPTHIGQGLDPGGADTRTRAT